MAMRAAQTPAVFIDKDGTLVHNVPHNVDPDLLTFMPGAMEALSLLSRSGFALVVVTNQPGLALGRFTWRSWQHLARVMLERVQAEAGLLLDDVMVCPHPPGLDGMPMCLCRKPAPGLLKQASLKHGIDLRRSWMVGDILDDVEAGHRAGCRSILLDVGGETQWRMSPLREPEHHVQTLLDAAHWIVAHKDAPRAPGGSGGEGGGAGNAWRHEQH